MSSSAYKDTNTRGAPTFSKPNSLPKDPSPNTLTRGTRVSKSELGWGENTKFSP